MRALDNLFFLKKAVVRQCVKNVNFYFDILDIKKETLRSQCGSSHPFFCLATFYSKIELGCTAMAIFKYIEKKGYEGKYTILREYCKNK
ncbi:hypothetical protein AAGY42_13280, partial [Staphylococcus aureus]